MTSIIIEISDPLVVDGLVEGANRNGTTAEAIATEIISRQGLSYAELFKVASITSAAFIARFTPGEYAAILQAAEVAPEVRQHLDTLLSEPIVNFYDPRVLAGLNQLEAVGLIQTSRIEELMAYDRPVPNHV
jgi:hypothetical protein